MAGSSLDVVTRFVADTSGLEEGAKKATSALGGISPAAILAGGAVVGAAGIAISAIADMTSAAAEDEAQQGRLEAAIRAAGAATGDYKNQVDAAIAAGQAKAFTDTQTREALQSLVTATGSVTEATSELSAAQDIARFANVDLATAADAVAKAHAGQDGALRKLMPGLEKGKTATDTLAAAQKAAAGASDEYAASTEGQMAVASDAFGELGETIGSAFLPLVKAIIPPLISIIKLLGDLISFILPPITILFGALGTAIAALLNLWIAEATWIGTTVTLLSQRLAPILRTVGDVFDGVGRAISGVVDWLRQLLDWIGRAVDAVAHLLDNLNPLKGFSLPSLPFSLAAGTPTGVGASPLALGATVGATVNVHVYGGDPRRVVDAVREGFRRWTLTDGGTAPVREW